MTLAVVLLAYGLGYAIALPLLINWLAVEFGDGESEDYIFAFLIGMCGAFLWPLMLIAVIGGLAIQPKGTKR